MENNHSKFEGQWKNDTYEGVGILQNKDGIKYFGQFKKN